MLHFSEAFVGGFFGFGRTYGAAARLACGSAADLAADWPAVLRETAAWRARRGPKATALHLYVDVPPAGAWAAAALVTRWLVVPPALRPAELRGLALVAAVFGSPGLEQYLDLTVYPEGG